MNRKTYLSLIEGYGEPCADCDGLNQPYMIQLALWKKLVSEEDRKKMICIPCIEKRLGRGLKTKDFLCAPINLGIFGFDIRHYCPLPEGN